MKTAIKKTGDTVIVTMDGKIDFESNEPFRADLQRLVTQSTRTRTAASARPGSDAKSDATPTRIIFDFERLEFVGSSGISTFIQTLREFNQRAPIKPKYCHVRSEFKKLIQAFDEEQIFEIHDTVERAKKSFDC